MTTPLPLTADQRRQLIEQPISIRTIGGSARWGGTGVASDDGTHRTYTPRRMFEDEPNSYGGDNHGQ